MKYRSKSGNSLSISVLYLATWLTVAQCTHMSSEVKQQGPHSLQLSCDSGMNNKPGYDQSSEKVAPLCFGHIGLFLRKYRVKLLNKIFQILQLPALIFTEIKS